MTFVDRQAVECGNITAYIGRRTYPARNGHQRVSSKWTAECCYQGLERHRPLRTSSLSEARRAARRFIRDVVAGSITREIVTISGLCAAYLDLQTNRNRSPRTLEKYRFGLQQLQCWCDSNNLTNPEDFTEELFWEFNQWMHQHGSSEKTIYDRLILVKQLFRFADRRKIVTENRLTEIILSKPESSLQPCFTAKQVAALLEAATGYQRTAFALMAYAGMRFGEVRDLQWDDLLFSDGVEGIILIRRGGSNGSTKNRRNRRLPIHPDLRKILMEWPRSGNLVVSIDSKPVPERILLMALKSHCKTCQFEIPHQYKLHTFRHTFASMCARSNIAFRYSLEWMGHRRSEVLDLYYKMFDDTAAEAMRTIKYS